MKTRLPLDLEFGGAGVGGGEAALQLERPWPWQGPGRENLSNLESQDRDFQAWSPVPDSAEALCLLHL